MLEINEEHATYWIERFENSPRGQRAQGLFLQGYNCTQAVVLAFDDLLGMDWDALARLSSSFGGGMGRLREVCGAVSGMFLVAGILYGYDVPGAEGQELKAAHYKRIQQLAKAYQDVNGSIVCRELLGLGKGADDPTPAMRTNEYYKKRPCPQLAGMAATIMEAYLAEWEKQLSVCIITKNESEKLEQCLRALAEYPVEIVVVDTGSTDDTKQIASRYTDKIYDFSWCDDFSRARNFAIEKASHEYVMMIDSDEYVKSLDVEALLKMLSDHPGKVGRICIHNQFTRDGERQETVEWINRIFCRRYFHYAGRIHEQVEALSGEEYETFLTDVVVAHDGYDGSEEERHKKAKRNIALLQAELSERPDDVYIQYQLGKSYYMSEAYEQAVDIFRAALEYDVNPKLEYVVDMVETYGYALLKTDRAEEALCFENIYDEFGDSSDFKFLMGLIYMNNGCFEEAVNEFEKATAYVTARTIGTNGFLSYYNAGVIRECLGQLEEAASYYKKAGDYQKAKERDRKSVV